MSMISRKPKASARRRTSGAVVYKGAGAPLLGDKSRTRTKKQADEVIDALLGKGRRTS